MNILVRDTNATKIYDLLLISKFGLKKNLWEYVVKKAFNSGRKY